MKKYAFELRSNWQPILSEELEKPYMLWLSDFIEKERTGAVPVYPSREMVFNAFAQTPFHDVKVVIMGQDPYHGQGQAHGLSFSVPKGVTMPPSLKNIFKEMASDIGTQMPTHGCLSSWAQQGVLLLNATLTVRQGQPLSHHGKGWEHFTDHVIARLSQRKDPPIFVLWGKNAQDKWKHVFPTGEKEKHTVLLAPHPSPYSAASGFFGCRHFSKINEFLIKIGKTPINWQIE